MTPRWMAEYVLANGEREILQTVIIYAEGETVETVRKENKGIKHDRKLLLIDAQ